MNKKKKLLTVLILTLVFTSSLFYITKIGNNDDLTTDNNTKIHQLNDDLTKEDPTDFEELDQLKTANGQSESSLNFSFDSKLDDVWNSTWYFENYESFQDLELPYTEGHNVSYLISINDLRNKTTMQPILPSDLSANGYYFILAYRNGTYTLEFLAGITDFTYQSLEGNVAFPNNVPGTFLIASNASIIYNVTITLNSTRSEIIRTEFIPDPDNTITDMINWELRFSGYAPGNYSGVLEVDEISKFTLHRVLGNEEGYWRPINYTKIGTQFFFNKSYLEYLLELRTPNYLSVTFNDNLTVSNNELRLYATCNMPGNLTIEFTDANGTLFRNVTENVENGQIVFYNYIMPLNSSGGIGFLNITLTNSSNIYFGAKFADITFFKQGFIYAFTSNTTAFSEFYAIAPYIDYDIFNDLVQRNNTYNLGLTIFEILNRSIIHGATVTYELGEISGELEDTILVINESGVLYNANFYFKVIDLREYLIPPGEYNLTFRASKPGYTSVEYITSLHIFKKDVYILVQVTPPDNIFTIEEPFALAISMHVYYPHYENFLRVPVNLSIDIWRGTVLEDHLNVPNVVQSLTLQDVIGNTTIPGDYTLNITILSEYYEGNVSVEVEIQKKELDLSLVYDNEVDEDEDFDILWSLEHGNFTGNRENMTLEIYLDGRLISTVNLTATNASSGVLPLKLDEGDYTITYRLTSPFYEAERIISIEATGGKSKKEEPSWLEENWFLLLLLILAIIAMSIFGVYMTISRRRVKAQRELDSELVALKTRIAATEDNISLIQTQISEIAGIYWILVIHSEQGTTMVEITEFRFSEVLGEEFKVFVEEGMIRDSALIGGFLTAIRNFSRETSGESHEYQPIFNSQTDYSTIVNEKEVHRRILEGTGYFMAFISARGTMEISEVLSAVNSKFHEGYGDAAKEFLGKITVFNPFKEEVVRYLHNEIRELQKKLEDEILLRQHYESHLKKVQDKIGIKKNK